jgi:hypothetical protein
MVYNPESPGDMSKYAQIGLPQLPKAASREEFDLLCEWIRICDVSHQCLPPRKDGDHMPRLPTRVIYVGEAANSSIRLVQTTSDTKINYAALSHCWGQVSKSPYSCLLEENVDRFQIGIELEQLPRMFQDAIVATRALNISYLWIDSLCIIQDNNKDWETESKKMEDVYSFAYVTLAASSAGSSLEGFLGGRPDRSWAIVPTSSGPLYIAEAIDDFQSHVEDAVLSTRAWVLQERVLSRRTIHFTSTQIYWECGKGVHCETLAQLRNPTSNFLGDSNFPAMGLSYFKDERIRLIQYLYKRYSDLTLSNATDRPVAISGLETRLGRTFESGVNSGVFEKFFERTILWTASSTRLLSRIEYKTNQVAPPSWSWMSYSGAIRYLEIPFGEVDWTGDLENPFLADNPDTILTTGIVASARKITIDELELFSSVTLDTDVDNPDFTHSQWRVITVGKSKEVNMHDDDMLYYVLLVRPVPLNKSRHTGEIVDRFRPIYERAGVGVLNVSDFSTKVEKIRLI